MVMPGDPQLQALWAYPWVGPEADIFGNAPDNVPKRANGHLVMPPNENSETGYVGASIVRDSFSLHWKQEHWEIGYPPACVAGCENIYIPDYCKTRYGACSTDK